MDTYNKYKITREMWDNHTVKQIAERLGISRQHVYNIKQALKKEGIILPSKKIRAAKKLANELNENQENSPQHGSDN